MSPVPAPETLSIPLRKGTLLRLCVLALLLVAGAVRILTLPGAASALRGAAALAILLFGSMAVYAAWKLLDRTPALLLDAEGLVDHSNALAAGRVRWDEITQIRVLQVLRHRFLSVSVREPEKFIERGGALRRRMSRENHRKVGTPINIRESALAMPFDRVVERVAEFYRAYGRPA